MNIGDIVRLTDVDEDDTRGLGVVMCWDVYSGHRARWTAYNIAPLDRNEWDSLNEPLAKVLWSGRCGAEGWVLVKRLEVVSEAG